MLRKIASVFTIVATASTLVSAAINFDTPKNTSIQQEIANLELSVPVSAPVQDKAVSTKTDKEWTIMVFINGKNNLEPYALKDMNEMEQVGSTDKVNIVTETGLVSGYGDMPWTGTARFLIKKDNDTNTVTSPILANLGSIDMGGYQSVIDFANWAKATYPAKHYMLVIWNHGSGWDKSVGITRGISYDDETNNHITTPQLGQVLKGIGGVDVYGSDACLMQMAEVTYELKDNVTYIVGSEETEPGDGYTYNDLLGPLAAKPAMTPKELGTLAANAYADHYQAGNEGSTQSLLDTAALPQFLTLMNNFANAMMKANEKAAVKTAISGAQSFAVADNHDVWHFASLMAKSTKNAAVKSAAAALQSYISGSLILVNRPTTANYTNAHGISAYMPSYGFNGDYNSLAWAQASQWDEFIKWYQK